MCGHVGIFGSGITANHVDAFEDLLFMDALRGEHATGVARVDVQGVCHVIKKPLPSWEFLKATDVQSMLRLGTTSMALIGHNRYATQGALTAENAHPFTHDHITMAHNGTLLTRYGLEGSLSDFEVDSNHIAYTLSRQEPTSFLGKVNGAYALVWHDDRNNTIHFVRNAERPMYIAKVKDKDVYMYASEMGMLYAAATRKRRNIVFDCVDELPIHTIRSYQLTKSFKESITQLEDVTFTKEASSYSWDDPWWERSNTYYGSKKKFRVVNGGKPAAGTLAIYKLSTNDEIAWTPLEFVPYNKNSVGKVPDDQLWGAMIGYCDHHPYFDVVVAGITASKAAHYITESNTAAKTVYGKVVCTGNSQRYGNGELVSPDPESPYVSLNSSSLRVSTPALPPPDTDEDELDDIRDSLSTDVYIDGHRFTLAEFNHVTKYGCAVCSKTLYAIDANNLTLTSDKRGICCKECAHAY